MRTGDEASAIRARPYRPTPGEVTDAVPAPEETDYDYAIERCDFVNGRARS
ncbi:hypothetical protein GCM10010393_09120 [Streptomyces gobitricini]|uniref:Uncharacterized protein n=1 Tax=Streptomyces gobitricini TaxID=68211 RepID=A0ABN3LD48_9ACTN